MRVLSDLLSGVFFVKTLYMIYRFRYFLKLHSNLLIIVYV